MSHRCSAAQRETSREAPEPSSVCLLVCLMFVCKWLTWLNTVAPQITMCFDLVYVNTGFTRPHDLICGMVESDTKRELWPAGSNKTCAKVAAITSEQWSTGDTLHSARRMCATPIANTRKCTQQSLLRGARRGELLHQLSLHSQIVHALLKLAVGDEHI